MAIGLHLKLELDLFRLVPQHSLFSIQVIVLYLLGRREVLSKKLLTKAWEIEANMGPRPRPLLLQRLPGPTDTQGRAGDSLEHKGGPQGPASCLSFSSWSNFNKLLQCWSEGRGERLPDAQRIYEVRQNWPKHEVLKFSSSSLKSTLPSHHQAAPGTPRDRSRAHRATNPLSYSPVLRRQQPLRAQLKWCPGRGRWGPAGPSQAMATPGPGSCVAPHSPRIPFFFPCSSGPVQSMKRYWSLLVYEIWPNP